MEHQTIQMKDWQSLDHIYVTVEQYKTGQNQMGIW